MNGNLSVPGFEMKFSESKDRDRIDPANDIKELGIYLIGHGEAAEEFKAGKVNCLGLLLRNGLLANSCRVNLRRNKARDM